MELPGTNIEKQEANEMKKYLELVDKTGGVSLNQICTITNLDAYMIQNWVKRGYVPHPLNKKYTKRHLARILLINSLKECMKLDDVGELMKLINGDVDDESDDIISEDQLYLLFCDMVFKIKDIKMAEKVIESGVNNPKIQLALKVMVYAYQVSILTKQANKYLYELKGE